MVLRGAWPSFAGAWKSLVSRSLNMFTVFRLGGHQEIQRVAVERLARDGCTALMQREANGGDHVWNPCATREHDHADDVALDAPAAREDDRRMHHANARENDRGQRGENPTHPSPRTGNEHLVIGFRTARRNDRGVQKL